MANALIEAVVSVIPEPIRKYIGFSEPEKGPLANFHTYAPDMMKLFASGIRDNAGLIENALDDSLDILDKTYDLNLNTNVSTTKNSANNGEVVEDEFAEDGNYDRLNALADAIVNAFVRANITVEYDNREFGRLVRKLGATT